MATQSAAYTGQWNSRIWQYTETAVCTAVDESNNKMETDSNAGPAGPDPPWVPERAAPWRPPVRSPSPWGLQSAHPPSPFVVIRRGTRLLEGGGNVRLCLPLPLFPCPYMVLPVSQSLLVQSVSAVCLDYVPGVSSYVSLYIVCSAPCYLWIIVNVMCFKLVWMSFPVFLYPVLCVRHPLNTLFVISSSPRSWIPVWTVTTALLLALINSILFDAYTMGLIN